MDTRIQSKLRGVLFTALFGLGFMISVYSCNKQETSLLCETGEATEITENSVTLSGCAVLSPDLTGSVGLGFLLSEQDNPSLDNSLVFITNVIDQYGVFQIDIKGINSNTKYYFRAYVRRNDIYVFGAINSFETKDKKLFSVYATAELSFSNGDLIRIDPVHYDGFRKDTLTDNDLEDIFLELITHVRKDFKTAKMYLEIYDKVSGEHVRDEKYSVSYSSLTGHYEFSSI